MAKRRGKPAICLRIAEERRRLKREWELSHPDVRPGTQNPFTQEAIAKRVPVTLKTYRTWESTVEPSFTRLRQLAKAMRLPPNHFLPEPTEVAPSLDEERLAALVEERIRGKLDELDQTVRRLEELFRASRDKNPGPVALRASASAGERNRARTAR